MSRIYGVQFAKMPMWLLRSTISDRAVRLFALLDLRANEEGRAFPSRTLLAEELGCATSSLDRALVELASVGAVESRPFYREDGSRSSNSYWVWPAKPPAELESTAGGAGGYPAVGRGSPTHGAAISSNQNKSNQTQQQALLADAELDATFEAFWKAYPTRGSKAEARKAWPNAVKAAGSAEVIIEGAKRYASDPNRPPPRFIPHGTRWLKGERWNDGPEPSATGHDNGKPKSSIRMPIIDDRTPGTGPLTEEQLYEQR